MNPKTVANLNKWEPLVFVGFAVYFALKADWGSMMMFVVLAFYAFERNKSLYGPVVLYISTFHKRHQPELQKIRKAEGHTGQLSRTALLELNSKVINNRDLVILD